MRTRIRATLAAFTLAAGVLLVAGDPSATASPTPPPAAAQVTPGPHDDGPHPPLLPRSTKRLVPRSVPQSPSVMVTAAGSYIIDGLDLHDSSLIKVGGTYYLYGSMYSCGYQWYVSGTVWCGFGVSTATDLAGPWSAPVRLFSPSDVDPWSGLTWNDECGASTGQGCFNPRMVVRSGWGYNDSVPILWFNSPIDFSRSHANAYNVMGCASLLGPCGPGAKPNGSYNKPSLSVCSGNGDFGIITPPSGRPAIVCTMPSGAALNLEELNYSGSGGDGTGVRTVAGLSSIEGPGGYWDPGSSQYVITYSDPGCGYCSGTGTGYATATSLYGTWTAPSNVGFGQPANGRRTISPNSCGGQPRTVSVVDGIAYQLGDLWTGDRNETLADTTLTPLTYTPTSGVPGDGHRWIPPLSYTC